MTVNARNAAATITESAAAAPDSEGNAGRGSPDNQLTAGSGGEAEFTTPTPRHSSRRGNQSAAKDVKVFKGETAKMNGHVFQLHAERKNKAQFSDSMEALRIYSSTAYKNDIESLNILFTDLEKPRVAEPKEPEKTKVTYSKRKVTEETSKFEDAIYSKRIKQ